MPIAYYCLYICHTCRINLYGLDSPSEPRRMSAQRPRQQQQQTPPQSKQQTPPRGKSSAQKLNFDDAVTLNTTVDNIDSAEA